jgi:cation-transporting P-type ATPase E
MAIPADSILLEALGVQCEESMFTGESEEVLKNISDPLLCQSLILTGQGKAIVVAVGPNTVAGEMREKTLVEKE